MTTTLQIALLGVVQGLTEFLPVSSSGHLVLAQALLGVQTPAGATLEVALHAGSILSIACYYRRRLLAMAAGLLRREPAAWSLAVNVLVAAVPVLILYPLCGDRIEAQFDEPRRVAVLLCVTGLLLLSSRWAPLGTALPRPRSALVMGLAQALALLPGISRSGSTLVAARWQRLAPAAAAELSFLMVLPLLCGAALLHLPDALEPTARAALPLPALGLGLLASALVGYAALALLVRVFASARFHWFGLYCLAAGAISLWLLRG